MEYNMVRMKDSLFRHKQDIAPHGLTCNKYEKRGNKNINKGRKV